MNEDRDASNRVAWPPIIFASGAALAAILTFLHPLPFLFGAALVAFRILGIVLVVAALAMGVTAIVGFVRSGTAVPPTRATTAIVVEGPYRYTRNPMYLGFTIILAALALAVNSLWFLLAAPVAVLAVTKLAIEPEERYLEAKFGQRYLAYKTRVRRWF